MRPTDILRQEHEAILSALGILAILCEKLGSGEGPDPKHMDSILEFITVFADQCHHGKEETLLFPAMESAGIPREGGPLCVMLMEHQMGRGYVNGMEGAWERFKKGDRKASHDFTGHAAQYIDLLTRHIAKENECLFPMAERCLKPEVEKGLLEDFETMEIVKIGRGRHEEFHRLLDSLRKIYLKDELPDQKRYSWTVVNNSCGSQPFVK